MIGKCLRLNFITLCAQLLHNLIMLNKKPKGKWGQQAKNICTTLNKVHTFFALFFS